MSHYCKYHPKQLAIWFCQSCDIYFCGQCVPPDKARYVPQCTLCRRSLKSLSVAVNLPPFWQRFSYLVKLPMNKVCLGLITGFALLLGLFPANPIGFVLLLLLMLPILELMLGSMEKVASGEGLGTKLKDFMLFENNNQFLKVSFICLTLNVAISRIYEMSPSIGIAISAFFILGVPASLIILMMEKSMLAMVNPIKIGFIIKQFKSAYLVLYGLLLAVAGLIYQFHFIADESTFWLVKSLVYVISLYLLMVVSVMSGYLVFQFHHELNFIVNRQSIYDFDPRIVQDKMAEVGIFIQEGRYEEAQKLLLDKIAEDKSDYDAYEKLILLYVVQDKKSFMVTIANQYFAQLLKDKKMLKAAKFYQKLTDKSIAFVPENIEVVIGLSHAMKTKNYFNIALPLIKAFKHKNVLVLGWEKLYLVEAQLLVEYANRQSDAIELLNFILKRSFDDDALQQAEEYLQFVQQIK
ncbi:B-box zinc finger protein [Aliikangiella maris]|uniref:B-box zinc finger protein n=2 Tax=Aliikangiella maris TaxID=3162458 RepID=A0ABV2BVQ7_9GAMM